MQMVERLKLTPDSEDGAGGGEDQAQALPHCLPKGSPATVDIVACLVPPVLLKSARFDAPQKDRHRRDCRKTGHHEKHDTPALHTQFASVTSASTVVTVIQQCRAGDDTDLEACRDLMSQE